LSVISFAHVKAWKKHVDEIDPRILGSNFSAIDIMLAVVLNRLALLGYRQRFWADRPFIEKFIRQIQERPSFLMAVGRIGLTTGFQNSDQIQMDSGKKNSREK
jgi:glutathione S-transferase